MSIPIKVTLKKSYSIVEGGSSGGGAGEIADGSITTEKLKDNAVTPEKLDREYLSQARWVEFGLNGFAPLTEQVNDHEERISNLEENGVGGGTGSITDGSVTTEKLADGSVNSAKINDSSVTETKIANRSVTSEKLAEKYATLITDGIENIEIPENVETTVCARVIDDMSWHEGVSIPWITEVSSVDEWLSSIKSLKYSDNIDYTIDENDVFALNFGNNSVVIINWAVLHVMFLVDESDIRVAHNVVDEGGNMLLEIAFPKAGFYSQNNSDYPRCVEIDFGAEYTIDEKYLPDDLLNLSDKYATKEELEGVYTVLDSLVETVEQKFSGIIGGVTEFDLTEKDFANVTATRRYAFYQNTALKNVILPETLKEVGVNTFRGCTGLLTVIMKGLTTLQAGAFYDCTALTDFYLPDVTSADEVPTLNATAFTNTTCNFNVSSEEVKEFYLTDSIWNTFADRFQIKAISQ